MNSAHIYGNVIYEKEKLLFAHALSLENSEDSYLHFHPVLLHSESSFSSIDQSSPLDIFFDAVSCNVVKVFSIYQDQSFSYLQYVRENFKNASSKIIFTKSYY